MKVDIPVLKRQPPFYRLLLGLLFFLSLAGLGISIWAHGETWLGIDPGRRFQHAWIVQLALLGLLLPLAFELFSKRDMVRFLRSPAWMRVVLYSFLVYYGLNFYFFLYWAADHLTSLATWRMFSSGWLLLFGLATVYYEVRFSERGKDEATEAERRRRKRPTGLGL